MQLEGFTTVILLYSLIIGSLIMPKILGIIGIYIAKIYEEVKGRPRYFIARKISGRKRQLKRRLAFTGWMSVRRLFSEKIIFAGNSLWVKKSNHRPVCC